MLHCIEFLNVLLNRAKGDFCCFDGGNDMQTTKANQDLSVGWLWAIRSTATSSAVAYATRLSKHEVTFGSVWLMF